jgi:pantoate--beta-alanine ligase
MSVVVGKAAAALVTSPEEWRRRLDAARSAGDEVGLVPTMGALHAGHLSLIRRAAADCGTVAVTVYVNPLQFGSPDDLAAYPRDLDRDREVAASAGAHLVFAPTVAELWPRPTATAVAVSGVSEGWEGLARPGHFAGMATIVAKLLALAGPCLAYFGEKDWQQLAVVRRMVEDLSLPAAVVGCPTVRDPDGLALSSRNARLGPDERALAPQLYWSLLAGKRAIEEDGVTDPVEVAARMGAVMAGHPALRPDYAAAVDPDQLTTPGRLHGDVRLLVAAGLGPVRLIDNLGATVPEAPGEPVVQAPLPVVGTPVPTPAPPPGAPAASGPAASGPAAAGPAAPASGAGEV